MTSGTAPSAGELAAIMNLLDVGRSQEARTRAAALAAASPGDPEALRLLAIALRGCGAHEEALAVARAAVAAGPERAACHEVLATLLKQNGDETGALEHAVQATGLNPHWPQAWVRLALVAAGRPQGVDAARRAVELAPGDSATHNALGVALLSVDRSAAAAAFERALAINPSSSAARSNLALVDLKRRRIARAAQGFADSARLDPRSEVARRNLRVTVVSWVTRASVLLLLAVNLMNGIAGGGGGSHSQPASARTQIWLRLVWFVSVGLAVAVTGIRISRMSHPLRSYLAYAVRRVPPVYLWLGLLVASAVAVSLTWFEPPARGSPQREAVVVVLFVLNLARILLGRLRRGSRRSRRPRSS